MREMVFMAVLDVKILEETYLCKISDKNKSDHAIGR